MPTQPQLLAPPTQIYDAVRLKAEVVALDEREAGVRSTLNFGHTIGHAVESVCAPDLFHGECVSLGCIVEGELAVRLAEQGGVQRDSSMLPDDKVLTRQMVLRLSSCFELYGLPVSDIRH